MVDKSEAPHESAKFSPVEENKTYTPQEEPTSADPRLDQSQLDSSDLVTSETNPGAMTPTAVESPIETKPVWHRKRFQCIGGRRRRSDGRKSNWRGRKQYRSMDGCRACKVLRRIQTLWEGLEAYLHNRLCVISELSFR